MWKARRLTTLFKSTHGFVKLLIFHICVFGRSTIENENLHEISNDNGVTVLNFATCKNFRVKSTMFPHRNIHKYTWTSPEGKTHNQIDHILVDRRRHSNVLDVRSFRAADCDSEHYLVVAKVRERLAVSKQKQEKLQLNGTQRTSGLR
jgi:hypothetical protein